MIEPGDVQIDAFETNGIRKGKRRATEEDDTIRPLKARTLGGDRPREAIGPVKELRPIGIPNGIDVGYRTGSIRGLEPPTLKTYLSCKGDEKEGYFMEGMNHEDEKSKSSFVLFGGPSHTSV
jgi:protein HIRA/HIR1